MGITKAVFYPMSIRSHEVPGRPFGSQAVIYEDKNTVFQGIIVLNGSFEVGVLQIIVI